MNRRKFVQICVGGAAVGTLAASTWAMARPLVIPRLGGGALTNYFGAQRVAGPAPRGVPLIPIQLNSKGEFEGKTSVKIGDKEVNTLDWYKYCGHQGSPGLDPSKHNEENGLTYFIAEEKLASVNPWYKDLLGQPIKPEHFPDVEFGAGFNWRSKGETGPNVLSGAIIRYAKSAVRWQQVGTSNPAKPLKEEEYNTILESFYVVQGDSVFAAASTFCTHFCCIPGYKEAEKLAKARNAWDKMYCTCHNSVYDPRTPVRYTFFPDLVKEQAEAA